MAAKTLELFVFRNASDYTVIGNAMPVITEDGDIQTPDGAYEMDICDEGLKVFGLRPLAGKREVFRISLTIESVAVGKYEIVSDFKEFVPVAKRARKKKS